MGLLQEAVNEQAYLKAAFFGDPGSGKTTTGCYLAMGIVKEYCKGKPVAFFETEAGSDFLVKKFNAEGIKLMRHRSHSLVDLLEVAKEAEQTCSCLIVDSITHVWQELCRAKLEAVNARLKKRGKYPIEKLEFQHWDDIKAQWSKWTNLYLNSKLHIIVCGRAGDDYDTEKDEETGKSTVTKIGTKMKAEKTFAYEPFLLVEMQQVRKGPKSKPGFKHCANILKDKSDLHNGLIFEFEKPRQGYEYKPGDWKQTFKPFRPIINSLNINGTQLTVDTSRNSESLFPGAEGESRGVERAKLCTIACEEIQGLMVALWPGQDAASKAMKAAALDTLFGTRSWTAVESAQLEALNFAVQTLRKFEKSSKNYQFENIESMVLMLKNAGKVEPETSDEEIGAGFKESTVTQ